ERQHHHSARDRSEQHGVSAHASRTTGAGLHGPMLRMCQLLPVFRHGTIADQCPAAAPQSPPLASAVPLGGQVYPAGGGGTGTGGATAGGFIADVIIGITTPLSRSIAWLAPNCCAALLRSLSRPPPPVLDAAGIAEPRVSPPRSGNVCAPPRPVG